MKIDKQKTNSMNKIWKVLVEYEDYRDQIDIIAQTLIKLCIYYEVKKEDFTKIISDYYDDVEDLVNLARFPTISTKKSD